MVCSSPLKPLATGLGVTTTGAIEDYIYCIANGETHEQALKSAAINGPIEGLTVGGCKWLGNAVSNKIKAKKLPRPAVQKKSTLSEATDVQEILWGRWHDYPKVKINGNEYAEIGNRLYTRHAVARMQPSGMRYTNFSAGGKIRTSRIIDASELDYGRSISPDIIEYVINNGVKSIAKIGEVERQIFTLGTVEVVTEQAGKLIVTILTH